VSEILQTFVLLYLLSQSSAVVGALVLWLASDDGPPEQASPQQPVLESLRLASAVSHRRTVSWPVPAPEPLKDDTTRAIRPNKTWCRTGYLHDEGQHRTPDSVIRDPGWTAELPKVTSPQLDWSAHPTAQLPEVGHRSGEYPVNARGASDG
jgi:hypothetical protein